MRIKTILTGVVAAVSASLLVATPAAAATKLSSTFNVLAAMHGEATAYASYLAFADHAAAAGNADDVAALFRSVGKQERDEHFAELAELIELVGADTSNLGDAIVAESYQATTQYAAYAWQAQADADPAAVRLFQQLIDDEAAHRALLERALKAAAGECAYPTPPTVKPVAIVAGPAKSGGVTLENLRAALRTEAYDAVKYRLYAKHAAKAEKRSLARLFAALSGTERLEHFAALANLAGLVADVNQNLQSAIDGENHEATKLYPEYAKHAEAAGDTAVAARFTELAADEATHRDAFADLLAAR